MELTMKSKEHIDALNEMDPLPYTEAELPSNNSVKPANEYQVGGSHYGVKSYQHWDWIEDHSVGYLEGCATKYLMRWKEKNGIADLQKARHYIQKLIELHTQSGMKNRSNHEESESGLDRFFPKPCPERFICYLLFNWYGSNDLKLAYEAVSQLIQEESAKHGT